MSYLLQSCAPRYHSRRQLEHAHAGSNGLVLRRTRRRFPTIRLLPLDFPGPGPPAPSAADLLSSLEEDDDEDFEEDDGLTAVETDETDVVFGTGKITPASMMSFVRQYPDSTLKFLLRRNLDGRPLPSEFDQIYKTWEERGLMRGRVRRYVLQIMDWEDVPDLPVHELLGQMRNRLMDMKLEAEQA